MGHSSRVHRAFSSMSVISPANVHPASQRKPKGAAGSALGFTETRSPALASAGRDVWPAGPSGQSTRTTTGGPATRSRSICAS
jgi:hypothetical protein